MLCGIDVLLLSKGSWNIESVGSYSLSAIFQPSRESRTGPIASRFLLTPKPTLAQVVKGGAAFRMAKDKQQPQARLPLFVLTAARTKYGLSMVGANGLEPSLRFSLRLGARGFELPQMWHLLLPPLSEDIISKLPDFANRLLN
jgi:hypothetical protein